MRVLVLADYTAFGGIGRYCINLVSGLRRIGVEVELYVPYVLSRAESSWLEEESARQGIEIHRLQMGSRYDLGAVIRLGRLLKQRHFDVIHTQAYRTNVLGRLAVLFSRASTKSIDTMHAVPESRIYSRKGSFYFMLDRLTSRWSAHHIAVDKQTRQDFVELGTSPDQITIVYNGVRVPDEVETAASAPDLQLPGSVVIGFVGRLMPVKGVDYLAQAAEAILDRFPNVCFLIVGEGPEQSTLAPLLEGKHGNRVIMTGRVNDVSSYYRRMDVLFMPSRHEGISLAALEAMSFGVPVVATAVGGQFEVIDDGENGLLAPAGDVPAMIAGLSRLILDADCRRQLGVAAKATVRSRFSADTMCKDTLRVYEAVS